MKKWKRLLFIGSLIVLLLFFGSIPVSADTDGTELQLLKPAMLEIQLGPEWSGVTFQLKTDAGLYPGSITVAPDGILRLEIGGSERYILSCMNSKVEIPVPEKACEDTVYGETTERPNSSSGKNADTGENISVGSDKNNQKQSTSGIPVNPVVLFITSLFVIIGTWAVIWIIRHKESNRYEYDDEEI